MESEETSCHSLHKRPRILHGKRHRRTTQAHHTTRTIRIHPRAQFNACYSTQTEAASEEFPEEFLDRISDGIDGNHFNENDAPPGSAAGFVGRRCRRNPRCGRGQVRLCTYAYFRLTAWKFSGARVHTTLALGDARQRLFCRVSPRNVTVTDD